MNNIIKKEGFDFAFKLGECEACGGNCCIGESGYIWINKLEIEALSKYLNLDVDKFVSIYLNKIGYKYSIKEVKLAQDNFACCFFDLDKRQCSIYEYRPIQCRTFPFWDYFKKNRKEVFEECPAIRNI